MRGFLVLLDKEWRDVRPIVVASTLLAGGAVFLLPYAFRTSDEYPAGAAQFIVPGLVALFVALVAADLVSAETQTGRIAALALLPTRMSTVWAAKAVLLLLTTTAFTAWVGTCQLVALLVLRPESAAFEFVRSVVAEPWQFGAVLAVGFATLFVSTLVERGFVSFVLGLVAGAGVVFGAGFAMEKAIEGFEPTSVTYGWIAAGVAAAFAVASLAAFTKGRVHTGARTRRLVVGLVALLACTVPASAAVDGWRRWSWLAISPGDPEAQIVGIASSPDGRVVAVGVAKMNYRNPRSRTWVPGAAQTWLIDVADGSLRNVRSSPCRLSQWDDHGRLAVIEPAWGGFNELTLEATSLTAVSSRFISESAWQTHGAEHAPQTWYSLRLDRVEGKRERYTSTVTWLDRGIVCTVDGVARFTSTPGVVYFATPSNCFVRRDLATGEETTILAAESKLELCMVSADGARVLAQVDGVERLYDAADGRPLGGPFPVGHVSWPWGAKGHRFLQAWDSPDGWSSYVLLDVDTGRRIDLGKWTLHHVAWPMLIELPDGRLVVRRADDCIDLLDADANLIRRLYESREPQEN